MLYGDRNSVSAEAFGGSGVLEGVPRMVPWAKSPRNGFLEPALPFLGWVVPAQCIDLSGQPRGALMTSRAGVTGQKGALPTLRIATDPTSFLKVQFGKNNVQTR